MNETAKYIITSTQCLVKKVGGMKRNNPQKKIKNKGNTLWNDTISPTNGLVFFLIAESVCSKLLSFTQMVIMCHTAASLTEQVMATGTSQFGYCTVV